jgi:hypothetical protein
LVEVAAFEIDPSCRELGELGGDRQVFAEQPGEALFGLVQVPPAGVEQRLADLEPQYGCPIRSAAANAWRW